MQFTILIGILSLATFWPLIRDQFTRLKKILVLFLLALPIVWLNPLSSQLIVLQIVFIGCLWALQKLPAKYAIFVLFISLVIFGYGSLISGKIISWPLNFHPDRLIFDEPTIRDGIKKHQLDAVYIPFRLRLSIYNQLIYVNYFFKNLSSLITLQRFYDIILLANIYPLLLGIKKFIGMKKNFLTLAILLSTGIALFSAGINKSTDPFNALSFALPLLLFFIVQGFTTMSEKIYLFLLMISIFISTTPTR